MQVQPLGGEDPLEEGMATTPGFLPEESHGQRSLVGYSPQDHKESDMTEATQHASSVGLQFKKTTSLVVEWLRLCTPTARGTGSISGWGTKVPQVMRCSQKREREPLNGCGQRIAGETK